MFFRVMILQTLALSFLSLSVEAGLKEWLREVKRRTLHQFPFCQLAMISMVDRQAASYARASFSREHIRASKQAQEAFLQSLAVLETPSKREDVRLGERGMAPGFVYESPNAQTLERYAATFQEGEIEFVQFANELLVIVKDRMYRWYPQVDYSDYAVSFRPELMRAESYSIETLLGRKRNLSAIDTYRSDMSFSPLSYPRSRPSPSWMRNYFEGIRLQVEAQRIAALVERMHSTPGIRLDGNFIEVFIGKPLKIESHYFISDVDRIVPLGVAATVLGIGTYGYFFGVSGFTGR